MVGCLGSPTDDFLAGIPLILGMGSSLKIIRFRIYFFPRLKIVIIRIFFYMISVFCKVKPEEVMNCIHRIPAENAYSMPP